ncbi:MAG: 4-vinyl reductase [Desulfobacterales bacterium]
MVAFDWKRELDRRDNQVVLSGQPIAIHCHHYNINLQKTLEDTLGQEGIRLIYESAEEAVYRSMNRLLAQYPEMKTVKSKLEMCAIMFQNCGLGIIHPQTIDDGGGFVISSSSHHVTGWLAKHGRRDTPGCHFTRGWLAGALAAICGKPLGAFAVKEIKCKMMRDPECIFNVEEH